MQQSVRHRVWPTFLSFFLALGALYFFSGLLIMTWLLVLNGKSALSDPALQHDLILRPSVLLASVVVSSGVAAAVATGAARVSAQPTHARLSLTRVRLSPAVWVLVVLGAPALGQLLETVLALLEVPIDGSLRHMSDSISQAQGWQKPLLLLVISLGPGWGEELLFRGYIQTRLNERWGPVIGILCASALFGVMHMDPVHSPLAGALGLYLGFVAYRFRTIVPAIAAHVVNNAVAALSIFLSSPEELNKRSVDWWSTGGALLIVCLSLYMVTRVTRQHPQSEEPVSPA